MEQLTSSQLAEWEAYERLEPFGSYKHDFEFGYLLSVITNLFIGAYGKKGTPMTKPESFILRWGEDQVKEQQSVEEMKSILMGIAEKVNKSKRVRVTNPTKNGGQ